ncbi:hypothetical protein [Verrucomicrobium sp. BvORR106]|uniref:hypothetical protein n=1 Tax=Verrucomicrobium sp. BvORR106 TaxID=1403819 RepID=UPI00056F4110|nr:hypothetical protein [Verrucomicrobium sp. BvORR106]
MAKTDPYFRFPLSALTYGSLPSECLAAIIDYSVVSAGIGAEQGDNDAYADLVDANPLPDPPTEEEMYHDTWYGNVCAGALLTEVEIGDWRGAKDRYFEVSGHCRGFPKSALVTIKAAWVWDALETALREEGKEPRNGTPGGWVTWREFRVLCAVLSVIGAKSFAWASTNTFLHRVCGYTSALARSQTKLPNLEHCQPLTRWMLEGTLNRLEELRFFLRVRISKSPTGRGGRTAYSIRHESREALIKEIRTPKYSKTGDYRKADYNLWTQNSVPVP